MAKASPLEAAPTPASALTNRPLMLPGEATRLARTFKVLASDTRLRLVHALVRAEELCVSDLAEQVGMRPQAVSNQLQRLVDRGIVGARREGNRIWYRVEDPCIPSLLDHGWCLTAEAEAALLLGSAK